MFFMKKRIWTLLAFAFVLAGCSKDPDGPEVVAEGPRLVSSLPEDGASVLTGTSLTFQLTFDQNVFCPTSERNRISVSNGASITRVDAYMKDVTLQLDGLQGGKTYTLTLPKGTVYGYRDNPADEISLSFSVKETKEPSGQDISAELVTSDPLPNARRLYDYLRSVYGQKTLSGAMAKVAWNTDEADWILRWTGKAPAIATFDYIHLPYSSPESWIDYGDIRPAKDWFDAGGIISAGWHWNVPKSAGGTDLTFGVDGSFKASNAVKQGTWENDIVQADLKKIAGYLKLLQDEGIPVLWRPLHEAAGNTYTQWHTGAWFWWGNSGADAYRELWKYMFDFFRQEGIRNLIWVWTTQTSTDSDADFAFYPGDDYVDIIGCDIYGPEGSSASVSAVSGQYSTIVKYGEGKMITLSECGRMPAMKSLWDAGAKWLYFTPWYDYDNDFSEKFPHIYATIDWWKSAFDSAFVVDRDSLPEDLYQ